MERGDVLGWNDDVRQLPERLRKQAGKVGAERIAAAWERELRRRNIPERTQVRWRRERGVKHGVKGALCLEGGLPQCEGLRVVVLGPPQWRHGGGSEPKRNYPKGQRHALNDGTLITTIELAWTAYAELQVDMEAHQQSAVDAAAKCQDMAGRDRLVLITNTETRQKSTEIVLRTRGGAALTGKPTRHFSDSERTLGAVIARMEAKPGRKTTRIQIMCNRLLAERVLSPDTRLDLITADGMQYIYDEIGGLHKLRMVGKNRTDWLETDRLIGSGHRNNLWQRFKALLVYARREGWLQNVADEVIIEPSVKQKEVEMLSREETLHLERYVMEVALLANEALAGGALPVLTPRKGRVWKHSGWSALHGEFGGVGTLRGVVDADIACVGHVPIVRLPGGVRYFSTGLAAYILIATGLAPRPGELNTLCWNSVDLEAGTITWERRLLTREQQQPGASRVQIALGTKNTKGERIVRRTVRVTAWIKAALVAWRAERAELRLAMGWQIPEAEAGGLVFPSTTGKVFTLPWSHRLWTGVERAAGVSVTRPHAVRHAVSTWNALDGVNPVLTSMVLGHSVQVEMEEYVKKLLVMADRFAALEEGWREEMRRQLEAGS
jgi:hypothetical protein